MTALPLALSISNTLLKAGALAAFAGLVGVAVLSLLVFSQARELKRLREWAGRAPERAAELEQRVSAEAAIRIQRTVQPAPRPAGRSTGARRHSRTRASPFRPTGHSGGHARDSGNLRQASPPGWRSPPQVRPSPASRPGWRRGSHSWPARVRAHRADRHGRPPVEHRAVHQRP